MNIERIISGIGLAQALLGLRVMHRLLSSRGGDRIQPDDSDPKPGEQVSIIVPVLNERARLEPCLEGLLAQGDEVGEILVVDGGSEDGTLELILMYQERDRRISLIDASPIPPGWNGKSWGLQAGLSRANPGSSWVLIIDADVRPTASLTRSLLAHAGRMNLAALSVATVQDLPDLGAGLVHPALLTTLIYRYGIPGHVFRRVVDVQANGQCFLLRRVVLDQIGGFAAAYDSLCEDVTLARQLVGAGHRVGFYEAGELVQVRMYTSWRDAWQNWTRSLPMRDRFSGLTCFAGLIDVVLVQALPLPLLTILVFTRARMCWITFINVVLAVARIGVLVGTARAYPHPPWTYWLSPLCDLPVAIWLWLSALRRRHVWRGRMIIQGERSCENRDISLSATCWR